MPKRPAIQPQQLTAIANSAYKVFKQVSDLCPKPYKDWQVVFPNDDGFGWRWRDALRQTHNALKAIESIENATLEQAGMKPKKTRHYEGYGGKRSYPQWPSKADRNRTEI